MATSKNIKKKKVQKCTLKTYEDYQFLQKDENSTTLNYLELDLIKESIDTKISHLEKIRWSVVCFDPSQQEYHKSIYQNIDFLIENLKMAKSKLCKIYSNQYKGSKCNS